MPGPALGRLFGSQQLGGAISGLKIVDRRSGRDAYRRNDAAVDERPAHAQHGVGAEDHRVHCHGDQRRLAAATRGRRPKGAAAITPVSRHGANFIRIIADRPPLSRGGRQPQLTAEDLAVVEPVSSCTFTVWDTAFSISAWSTHPAAPLRAIGSVSTAPMALPATPYTTKIRLNTTASPSC